MTESQLCRLCVDKCKDYESLYDENGFGNELYEITFKYFHPTILNMNEWKDMSRICVQCCRHIWDFHNFQKSTFVAQMKLDENAKEVVIKAEAAELVNGTAGEIFSDLGAMNVEGDFVSLSELAALESGLDSTPLTLTNAGRTRPKRTNCKYVRDAQITKSPTAAASVKIEKDCIALPEIELIDVHQDHDRDTSFEDELPTTSGFGNCNPDNDSDVVVLSDDADNEEADDPALMSRLSWDDEYEIPDFGLTHTYESHDVSSDELYAAEHDATSIRTKSTRRERNEQLDELMAKLMPTINCDLCSDFATSWPALQDHFRLKHPIEQCYILCCGRKLKEHWTLKEHLRYHNDPNIFKCKICGRSQTTKCTLKRHMDAQHPQYQQIKFVCKICNKGFTTNSGLKYHCTAVHGNSAQPERIVSADGGILYRCKECGKTFGKYTAGRQHIWYNHRFKSRYRCTICGNTYRRPRQYREHVAAHAGKHLYACAYCPASFTYFNSLQGHRKNKHPNESDDNFYKKIEGIQVQSQAKN